LRGSGEREGMKWVVREEVGAGGRNDQALYAHMNNKTIQILKKEVFLNYNGTVKDSFLLSDCIFTELTEL
jgi:hypothetical protein